MKAKWITVPGRGEEKNFYFRARKRVSVDRPPETARLRVAAESHYMLWINGHRLGRGPARGSRSRNFFDEYDVGPFLRPGDNWIAVLAQSMNEPNFMSFPAAAAVAIELDDIVSSDATWETLAASDWRRKVEKYTNQTGFSEFRDFRSSPIGWETGLDDGDWGQAEELGDADEPFRGKTLLQRPIPSLRETVLLPVDVPHAATVHFPEEIGEIEVARGVAEARHSNVNGPLSRNCAALLRQGGGEVTVEPPSDGDGVSIVFDFRREIIGFFELELAATSGTRVDIAHEEELADGRSNPLVGRYHFADRYITGPGTTVIGNTLHERGFRQVEIVISDFAEPVILRSVRAIDRRYPFQRRGRFHCDDMALNKIWDVCLETMSVCTTDVFTDCPWRERAMWFNDVLVENVVALQAFGDYRLNAHALRLAASNRRPDGWLPGMCPDGDKLRNVLVPTNLFFILILKDYVSHSGDLKLLEEVLPDALELLGLFEPLMDEDHLITTPPEMWTFIDWSYGALGICHDGRNSSTLNWLYCLAVETAAELLTALGDDEAAKRWKEKATPVAAGIENRFWDSSVGMYAEFEPTDGEESFHSKLCHAIALSSGALPENRRSAVLAALENEAAATPELYLLHLVLNQLRNHGRHQTALELIRHYWGGMLDDDPLTFPEYGVYSNFTKGANSAGSMCHGFSTTPVNYFQTAILGIQPTSPGFKTFSVNPVPHDLNFASGSVPTPLGNIAVDWRREGDQLRVQLRVPSGATARTPAGEFTGGEHEFTMKPKNQRETRGRR